MFCECGCGQRTQLARDTDRTRGTVKGKPQRFVIGHGARGRVRSAETRAKISAANTGYRHTAEAKAKINVASAGRTGSLNGLWKGDEGGYSAIHKWVSRYKTKTGKCSVCSHRGHTEWANISGVYFRELDDFAEMCIPCHKEFDEENFIGYAVAKS